MTASPLLVAIFSTFLVTSANAGLYRWVDENGNVTYSDQVPPDQTGGGHTELNQGGIRVREVGPAMSAEEAASYRAAETQRRAEQQRAEQQREADLTLLRSFPTQDEIAMARDGKLNTYDINIEVLFGYARRKKQRLLDMQEQISGQQRGGTPPGKSITAEMGRLQQQLIKTYSRILDEDEKKQAIRDEYAGYLRRYRELKGLPQGAKDDTLSGQPRAVTAVSCTGEPGCTAVWDRAVDYLTHSTALMAAITNDELVITRQPERNEDIGLTLVRVPKAAADGHWILLDLQCKATAIGNETCRSETSQSIRRGFNGLVTGDGSHAAQTAPARTPPKPAPAG